MVHNAQIHLSRTVLRNPMAYWTYSEDSAVPHGTNGQAVCASYFRNAALAPCPIESKRRYLHAVDLVDATKEPDPPSRTGARTAIASSAAPHGLCFSRHYVQAPEPPSRRLAALCWLCFPHRRVTCAARVTLAGRRGSPCRPRRGRLCWQLPMARASRARPRPSR